MSVFVIRPKTNELLPEYLAICLNSAKIQHLLRQTARGVVISGIRLNDLSDLLIPIVNLDRQKAIIKLTLNIERQENLLGAKQSILNSIQYTTIQKELAGVNQWPLKKYTQEELNNTLWNAADSSRTNLDASIYKDYVLVMLFFKYLSDLSKKQYAKYVKHYKHDKERIAAKMRHDRFYLPPKYQFWLYLF